VLGGTTRPEVEAYFDEQVVVGRDDRIVRRKDAAVRQLGDGDAANVLGEPRQVVRAAVRGALRDCAVEHLGRTDRAAATARGGGRFLHALDVTRGQIAAAQMTGADSDRRDHARCLRVRRLEIGPHRA